MSDEVKVKSLQKAMSVLECFTSRTPELGITQISELLNISKSNVHNIVSTFEKLGYIEQNPVTGKYSLGLKMLEYSYVINESLGYQRNLYHILRAICQKTQQVVFFGIPKKGEVLYISAVYPEQTSYNFPVRSITGEKAPMYCTGIGKAVLAFMKPEEAESYICGEKAQYTENTITKESELRKELEITRSRGYSVDDREHELEVKCVGVPVFDAKGILTAGVSVSGAAISFTPEKIKEYAKVLQEAAYQMRERL